MTQPLTFAQHNRLLLDEVAKQRERIATLEESLRDVGKYLASGDRNDQAVAARIESTLEPANTAEARPATEVRAYIDGSGETFGKHDRVPACDRHMCVPVTAKSQHSRTLTPAQSEALAKDLKSADLMTEAELLERERSLRNEDIT